MGLPSSLPPANARSSSVLRPITHRPPVNIADKYGEENEENSRATAISSKSSSKTGNRSREPRRDGAERRDKKKYEEE